MRADLFLVAVAAHLGVNVFSAFPDAIAIGGSISGQQDIRQRKASSEGPFHNRVVEQ
ncbi:hypothetical protein D3C76_1868960 [compost metagenome]